MCAGCASWKTSSKMTLMYHNDVYVYAYVCVCVYIHICFHVCLHVYMSCAKVNLCVFALVCWASEPASRHHPRWHSCIIMMCVCMCVCASRYHSWWHSCIIMMWVCMCVCASRHHPRWLSCVARWLYHRISKKIPMRFTHTARTWWCCNYLKNRFF